MLELVDVEVAGIPLAGGYRILAVRSEVEGLQAAPFRHKSALVDGLLVRIAVVATYVLRRLLSLVPTWLGISLVAFLLANLAPGDPAELILNSRLEQPPTQAQLEQFRSANGLDNPIALQYLNWVAGLVRGDLGTSFRSGQPVLEEIGARFPATLQITVPAFGLALLLAILIGVLSACAASAGRW